MMPAPAPDEDSRVRSTTQRVVASIGVVCLVGLLRTPLRAQAPPVADNTFRSAATAVVVDVIVRDGRGQPVRGLALADFELRENGVRQTLQAIDAITGPALPAAPATPAGTASAKADASIVPPGPHRQAAARPRSGRTIALVFDRLSADARPLAHKAALAYVDGSSPDDRIGVFLSDLRLETVQDYTADREALRRAVRRAATTATSSFDKKALAPINQNPDVKPSAHPGISDTASAEHAGRVASQNRLTYDENTLEGVGRRPVDTFWERLGRDQQGFATTNAIEAVSVALAQVPGRKALIFFAEGLAIPDAVLPQFERAVATANRAQVSVYSVDAKGLRVHSDHAEVRREVGAIGAAGVSVNADGSNGSSLSLLERNEDVLRKDADTSLRLLANRTGGVLINNTNDLSRVAGVVDLDFREHYVLTYQPANTDFHGEWRRIEVKVPDRRVTVRARAGYLAVKANAGEALLAHEARALAALDRSPVPTAVPIQLAALSFPEPGLASRIALLVATPLAAVATRSGDRYDADFTILARIRDASGAVVRTASEPYRIGGPVARDTMPGGRVLFFRHPQLAPGRYGVEVAIADAAGTKAGVTHAHVDVPAPTAAGLSVSALVIVEGAEAAAAAVAAENPLVSGGRMLYPSLTGDVGGGERAAVGVFFRVVAPATVTLTSRLELLRDGTAVSDVPLELGTRDAGGRVDYQAQLPVGSLAPGAYALRLIVSDGTTTVERRATFNKRP
jgi:VWFA-related protein